MTTQQQPQPGDDEERQTLVFDEDVSVVVQLVTVAVTKRTGMRERRWWVSKAHPMPHEPIHVLASYPDTGQDVREVLATWLSEMGDHHARPQ